MINSSPAAGDHTGLRGGARRRHRPFRSGWRYSGRRYRDRGRNRVVVCVLSVRVSAAERLIMATEADHAFGEAVAARVERRWAMLSIVIVGVLVGMATFIGIHQATMPQGHVETADPKTLHLAGEFIESNLGSAVEADGSITVRAIGQQYSFTPQCVVVPSETPITFPRHQRRCGARPSDRGHQHQHHAGAGLCF